MQRETEGLWGSWVVILGLIGGFVVLILSVPRLDTVGSGQAPTSTSDGDAADPIYSAAGAITLSLGLFPSRTPFDAEARLVSRRTFEIWSNDGNPNDAATPEPGDFDWTDRDPLSPVWLVGIQLQGLTVADILRPAAPAGVELDAERSATGGYYGWDANSGALLVVIAWATVLAAPTP